MDHNIKFDGRKKGERGMEKAAVEVQNGETNKQTKINLHERNKISTSLTDEATSMKKS